MDVETLKATYPDLELEALFPHFPRLSLSDYPELNGYTWQECHTGFIGAGGLFLVSDLAQKMALKPGMRLLDLCCGNAAAAIFLARHYGVSVVAADIGVDPTDNWQRVQQAGLAEQVTPVRMDARQLLLPHAYFDAIFCMNSYFYFGTDDMYLPYLARFVRAGGRIGIASPCYARELTPGTPREFLYDAPDFAESRAVHSPPWWRQHFEKTGLVQVHTCQEHPRSRELWLDDVRWLLEEHHPRHMPPHMQAMVLQQMIMLLMDRERFVTYLTLVAQKS